MTGRGRWAMLRWHEETALNLRRWREEIEKAWSLDGPGTADYCSYKRDYITKPRLVRCLRLGFVN